MTEPRQTQVKKGFPTAQISEPQEQLSQEQFLMHLLHLEQKDVNLKFVFDHIRNYAICGGMLWMGTKVLAQAHQRPDFFSILTDLLAGATLFALPWGLFALNFFHGVVAVSRLQDISRVSKVIFVAVGFLLFLVAAKLMVFAKGL